MDVQACSWSFFICLFSRNRKNPSTVTESERERSIPSLICIQDVEIPHAIFPSPLLPWQHLCLSLDFQFRMESNVRAQLKMHHKHKKPCWNIIINRCTTNNDRAKEEKTHHAHTKSDPFAKPNMAQCEQITRMQNGPHSMEISNPVNGWMHRIKILIDSGVRVQLIKHCLSIADCDDFVVSNEICKCICLDRSC